MTETNTNMKKRPPWIRWLRWSLVAVLGCVLFIGLLWAGLQTRWAKDRLAAWIASATAHMEGYHVTLEGLDGLIPFSILLDRITLSDAKGPWLEGRHLDISVKPASLLAGTLDVAWFRMEGLSIPRLPEPGPGPSGKGPADERGPPLSLPRVMVREIQVNRIDLGEAVAGTPLSYRLRSNVQTGGKRIAITAQIQDLDRPDDGLRLAAAYDLETRQMTADGTYRESRGGLLTGLMGLSDATGMELHITSDGPLSQAKGRLDLKIGGYGRAGINMEVGVAEPVTLTLDGQIQTEQGLLPEDVTAALGGPAVDIRCRAAVSAGQLIHIKEFTVRAPATTLSAEGRADLANGLMDMEATADPLNISPFLRGTGLEYQALGPVRVTAKGPFGQPEVTLAAAAGRFQAPNAVLNEIAVNVHAAFEKDLKGIKGASVSATAARVTVVKAPGLKGPLRMDVTATSPDFTRWYMDSLHLTAPDMDVRARDVRIDTATGDVVADLVARLDRMGDLLPPEAGGVNGRLTLHAHAEGNAATHQITTDLNMALAPLSGLPPAAVAAVGPELILDGRVVLKDDVLTLEGIHMAGGRADLDADGRLALREGTFDLTYHLLLKELSEIAGAMDLKASGDLEARGRISGGIEDFAAHMELLSDSLMVNNVKMESLHMQLSAKGLPGKPSGTLLLKGVTLDQPMQLDAGFAWSHETLSLSGVSAVLPGIDLRADLDIMPGQRRLSGSADGNIASFQLLSALTGHKVQGSGSFEFKASKTATHKPAATLSADLKDLRYADYRLSGLRIRARVEDMAALQGRVSIEASDGAVVDVRLDSVKVDVTGTLDAAMATLSAKGTVPATGVEDDRPSDAPVSVSARLQMTHDGMWRFRLEQLEGRYREFHVALRHPAAITAMDQEITLDELQLEAAGGTLQAKARLKQETVQASLRVSDLPMALFEPFVGHDLSGTVSAGCDISGLLQDPEVHVQAHVGDYRIPRGEGRTPILLEAALKAERRGNRFEADLTLSGLDKDPFTATASLPVRLSLKPFVLHLDKDGEMGGRLKGHLDLAVLRGMPALGDQAVSGTLEVDMGLTGSMATWGLNGGITIQDGRYESPATGTILADINGRLQADGRILRLTRLTATDGEAGTVAAEGRVTAEAPFPMDADLTFNQSTLLRKEVVTATASGKLNLMGNAERIDLTGEITLDRTEVTIPRRLPPDVVVIPVTEINLPPGMSKDRENPPEDSRRLVMDLSLKIPARFFVRGRGLDAEFKGQLTAQGPANNPVIRGTLQVVRGTFQFLARTFHITHGQIAFDGATPPVPLLNISTQVAAGQIDAQVQVTGPADAFRITLTSQPPLPQDEIMANILFGQSVAKLNAFQAYQLAASVSQLSGGGMPDLVGKTRTLLGVDRLSFSAGDDSAQSGSGPTISAGKYISEGVYVGVEQELTDAKQDVVVEVDLTPSFSVESKAGTRSGAGIGVNWKFDY